MPPDLMRVVAVNENLVLQQLQEQTFFSNTTHHHTVLSFHCAGIPLKIPGFIHNNFLITMCFEYHRHHTVPLWVPI